MSQINDTHSAPAELFQNNEVGDDGAGSQPGAWYRNDLTTMPALDVRAHIIVFYSHYSAAEWTLETHIFSTPESFSS
jgi:hypothetical protein